MKILLLFALAVIATSVALVNLVRTPDAGNLGLMGAALGIALAVVAGVCKMISLL